MKKLFAFTVIMTLVLSLAGCGIAPAAESGTPAAEPQVTAEAQTPAEDAGQTTPSEAAETPTETGRQDGERFEAVITLEGMEETVQYEHVRNEKLGFEMDYDYESFVRHSEADRECFVSAWDDPNDPENYLEVRYDTGNAELVTDAIIATLSNEYETVTESYTLDGAGSCMRIDASEVKGGGVMPELLQMVYVIPASDGCRVATAHYSIESAEGFGRRFAYMMNTLMVMDRNVEGTLTDEQALSAIQRYCTISNPELEGIEDTGDYSASWTISSSDEHEIVVLFQSYTGAEIRYYVDRITGETYATEFVPGITPEEVRTEESLNAWEYLD